MKTRHEIAGKKTSLPFAVEDIGIGIAEEEQKAHQPEKQAPQRMLKALIAEDNKINLMVIEKFLASLNMKSENVLNREQAVQQITSDEQYDLIFTDYDIPITKGHDATKAIKELQVLTNSSRNITCSLHRRCPARPHGRMH